MSMDAALRAVLGPSGESNLTILLDRCYSSNSTAEEVEGSGERGVWVIVIDQNVKDEWFVIDRSAASIAQAARRCAASIAQAAGRSAASIAQAARRRAASIAQAARRIHNEFNSRGCEQRVRGCEQGIITYSVNAFRILRDVLINQCR